MALQDEIERIKQAKADIKSSLAKIRINVGDGTIDTYSSFIDNADIGGGEDLEEYFETTVTNAEYFGDRYILKNAPKLKIQTTNLSSLFKQWYYSFVPELDDTSNVTNMSNMFSGAMLIKEMPQLNTSNVTDMTYMFIGCSTLKTILPMDTSKVTDMTYMFSSCSSITTVPPMNTSNVERMGYMFNGCSKLVSLPEFDCSKTKQIINMFSGNKNNFTDFGGLKDLGKSYQIAESTHLTWYTLDLSSCNNLTHDSLMNVINKLYDIKTRGCQPQQLILGTTNLAKLTEEEIAIATNKGWDVS